jgi:hypothetical protein
VDAPQRQMNGVLMLFQSSPQLWISSVFDDVEICNNPEIKKRKRLNGKFGSRMQKSGKKRNLFLGQTTVDAIANHQLCFCMFESLNPFFFWAGFSSATRFYSVVLFIL